MFFLISYQGNVKNNVKVYILLALPNGGMFPEKRKIFVINIPPQKGGNIDKDLTTASYRFISNLYSTLHFLCEIKNTCFEFYVNGETNKIQLATVHITQRFCVFVSFVSSNSVYSNFFCFGRQCFRCSHTNGAVCKLKKIKSEHKSGIKLLLFEHF